MKKHAPPLQCSARPSDLEATRRAVEAWRSTCRGPHGRMPEALWARAVQCSLRHGVQAVAARLRVRPATLLRRLGGDETHAESRKPVFIELAPLSKSPQECQIQVDRPDGAKLTMQLQARCAELHELVFAFLSRSS